MELQRISLIGKGDHPNTRLMVGDYIADILADRRGPRPIFHWIVQQIGSADVLYWGQEHSFEDAESAASDCLKRLATGVPSCIEEPA